jgi:hypothetical protein
LLSPPAGELLTEGEVVLQWAWRTFPSQAPFKVKVRVSGAMSTGASLGVLDSTQTTYAASGDTTAGALRMHLASGNYVWEVLVATQRDTLITSQKASFSLRNSEWPEVTRKENDAARAALREAQTALLQEPLTRIAHLERCAKQYPRSTWAPNAMYDIAYAYLRAGQAEKARYWLGKVLESYPGTQQAEWAGTALRKIGAQDFNIQLL